MVFIGKKKKINRKKKKEKGKENKLSPAMNSIKRTIGGGSGGNPQITTPPKKFQLLVWT